MDESDHLKLKHIVDLERKVNTLADRIVAYYANNDARVMMLQKRVNELERIILALREVLLTDPNSLGDSEEL